MRGRPRPGIQGTLTTNNRYEHKTKRKVYEATNSIPCVFCAGIIDPGDYFVMSKPPGLLRRYPKCNNCADFTIRSA